MHVVGLHSAKKQKEQPFSATADVFSEMPVATPSTTLSTSFLIPLLQLRG